MSSGSATAGSGCAPEGLDRDTAALDTLPDSARARPQPSLSLGLLCLPTSPSPSRYRPKDAAGCAVDAEIPQPSAAPGGRGAARRAGYGRWVSSVSTWLECWM